MDRKIPTSIKVSLELKEKLNDLKIHPRETYEDVIWRVIREWEKLKSMK